jgi:hypothetical protein
MTTELPSIAGCSRHCSTVPATVVGLLDAHQFAGLGVRDALDACLAQHPILNLDVPQPQQVERPGAVVLFSRRARLVPLDGGCDAGGAFDPLGKRAERPAQPVQADMRQARPC